MLEASISHKGDHPRNLIQTQGVRKKRPIKGLLIGTVRGSFNNPDKDYESQN